MRGVVGVICPLAAAGLLGLSAAAAPIPSAAGPAPAASSRCADGFDMPPLLQFLAAGGPSDKKTRDDISVDVLRFYQCRAFAAADPSACEPLKALPFIVEGRATNRAALCRWKYLQMKRIRSLIAGSPDYPAACLDNAINGESRSDPAHAKEMCALEFAQWRRPTDICRRFQSIHPREGELRVCENFYQSLSGSPAKCGQARKMKQSPLRADFPSPQPDKPRQRVRTMKSVPSPVSPPRPWSEITSEAPGDKISPIRSVASCGIWMRSSAWAAVCGR